MIISLLLLLLLIVLILPAHCEGFLVSVGSPTYLSFLPSWRMLEESRLVRFRLSSVTTTAEEGSSSQKGNSNTQSSTSAITTAITTAITATATSTKEQQHTTTTALKLQQKAQTLRAEIANLRSEIDEDKAQKLAKEMENIDRWIDDLLIQCTVDDTTQMLKNVDQVVERLMDGRYSQEQVDKIFARICDTGPEQSRSKMSPVMETFVDAVGKVDCVEREDNPNKRWSGVVERTLRKKLFAMDFGMRLNENDD